VTNILIGFKSVGKTTIGKTLATMLSFQFVDTDSIIEKTYNYEHGSEFTARSISLVHGEEYFRALEKKTIRSLNMPALTIIATGGGSILDPENIKIFKLLGKIIYLFLPIEQLIQRIMSQIEIPSFIDPKSPIESINNIFNNRQSIYEDNADYVCNCANKSCETIAREIIMMIGLS
jgi:shikimate kinase